MRVQWDARVFIDVQQRRVGKDGQQRRVFNGVPQKRVLWDARVFIDVQQRRVGKDGQQQCSRLGWHRRQA